MQQKKCIQDNAKGNKTVTFHYCEFHYCEYRYCEKHVR